MLPDSLFKPLEGIINRGIRRSASAAALCGALDNRSLVIDVKGTGLAFRLTADAGRIYIHQTQEEPADAEISGSPLALSRMVAADPRIVGREAEMTIKGDTEIAEQFRELLRLARPDLEEELSKLVGDVAAHDLADAARDFREWAGTAMERFSRNLGEYLQDESRNLPAQAETEEFMADVDTLANDLARIEARIARLKEQRNRDQPS